MANLKDIRKRIGSVKNTQKITRAMKLVAAARLRRSQEAITAARPYAVALERVVCELADRAGRDAHPLLAERGKESAVIVLMTSDRGLAGAFNASLIKAAEQIMREDLADFESVSLRTIGRKGNAHFARRNANIKSYVPAPTSQTAEQVARQVAKEVVQDFLEEGVDRIYLVFSEFKSAMTQIPTVKQLLPVVTPEIETDDRAGDFVYEPSKESLLEHLVPLYVQNGLFRGALESIASEFGARMSAMDSATRNAGEMIDKLSLQYNRARQAAITTELLEIVAGAEALKG